jgi:hypothetical protein
MNPNKDNSVINKDNSVIINGQRVAFPRKGEMLVFPNVPGKSELTQEQKNTNYVLDATKKSQEDNAKVAKLESRLAEIRRKDDARQAAEAALAAKQSNYNTFDENVAEEYLDSEDFDESVTTNKCGVGCPISGGRSKKRKGRKGRKSTKKRKLRKGRRRKTIKKRK